MSSVIVFVITVMLATLPIIELRGAMPIGMSTALWGDYALSLGGSALASVIGGILVCFVVVLIFITLKKLLSKITLCHKFFVTFETKANTHFEKFCRKHKQKYSQKHITEQIKQRSIKFETPPTSSKRKDTFVKCAFVFLFCATPLPLTGVWSAGALCSLLNLKFWESVLTLILANLFGSGIIALFCWIFQNYIDLVLTIMVIIMLLIGIYYLSKFLTNKFIRKDNSTFCD